MNSISRVEILQPEQMMAAIITMLQNFPCCACKKAEAIVVRPGQGERERFEQLLALWENKGSQSKALIITGHYRGERTWEEFTVEKLQRDYDLTRTEGVIIHTEADHTGEQSAQLIDDVVRGDLKSVAMFAPYYHLVRAYLTDVKQLTLTGHWIPVIPVPVWMSPSRISPETRHESKALIAGELKRIVDYQAEGFVATYEELEQYMLWLHNDSGFFDQL